MGSRERGEQPNLTFADLPPAILRELVSACEGRGIFSVEALVAGGIPREMLEPLVATHESNRQSPSSMIFNAKGKVLGAAIGIHDLELLTRICKDLGLSVETAYMGRGWQARDFQERIIQHLDKQIVSQAFGK